MPRCVKCKGPMVPSGWLRRTEAGWVCKDRGACRRRQARNKHEDTEQNGEVEQNDSSS